MKIQEHKRINAILFFACKEADNKINRLKLMKLLWLADRTHLTRYGRLILQDTYCALEHGPVPSKTKEISDNGVDDKFSVVGDFIIEAEDNYEDKYFSSSDIEVMEEIWENYGGMNRFTLRDISHKSQAYPFR